MQDLRIAAWPVYRTAENFVQRVLVKTVGCRSASHFVLFNVQNVNFNAAKNFRGHSTILREISTCTCNSQFTIYPMYSITKSREKPPIYRHKYAASITMSLLHLLKNYHSRTKMAPYFCCRSQQRISN